MKSNPSMLVAALVVVLSKFFKSIYDKLFPVGHEDETGFHYGKPKKPK